MRATSGIFTPSAAKIRRALIRPWGRWFSLKSAIWLRMRSDCSQFDDRSSRSSWRDSCSTASGGPKRSAANSAISMISSLLTGSLR